MKNNLEKYYYEAFVMSLVIIWLPNKLLAYLVPFLALVWFTIRANSGRTLLRTFSIVAAFFCMLGFHWMLSYCNETDYFWFNSAFSFLTYGSFFFLIASPSYFRVTPYYLEKYKKILGFLIAIQGIIGILQFLIVISSSRFHIIPGDAVQGSIGLLTFMGDNPGFGNQMYAINMVFMLMFYFPFLDKNKKGWLIFGLGFLAQMMAGVLHVFISFLLAWVCVLFFFRKSLLFSQPKRILLGISASVILILSLQFIFPGVFLSASAYLEVFSEAKSPKIYAVQDVLYELPNDAPTAVITGVGAGQFSSRAGLMCSGMYFGRPIPFLPNSITAVFRKYALPSYVLYRESEAYGNSTMHRPYFSLLSVFAEFGILLFVLLFYVFYRVARFRKQFLFYTLFDRQKSRIALVGGMALFYLIYISVFENYLETSQAIFPGLMILKLFSIYLHNPPHIIQEDAKESEMSMPQTPIQCFIT